MHEMPLDDQEIVVDDLSDHLKTLRAELAQIVDDMTAINATSAAAAHYRALRICERFLTTPAAFPHDEA